MCVCVCVWSFKIQYNVISWRIHLHYAYNYSWQGSDWRNEEKPKWTGTCSLTRCVGCSATGGPSWKKRWSTTAPSWERHRRCSSSLGMLTRWRTGCRRSCRSLWTSRTRTPATSRSVVSVISWPLSLSVHLALVSFADCSSVAVGIGLSLLLFFLSLSFFVLLSCLFICLSVPLSLSGFPSLSVVRGFEGA